MVKDWEKKKKWGLTAAEKLASNLLVSIISLAICYVTMTCFRLRKFLTGKSNTIRYQSNWEKKKWYIEIL